MMIKNTALLGEILGKRKIFGDVVMYLVCRSVMDFFLSNTDVQYVRYKGNFEINM